jgi:hypothetical protein
MKQHHKTYGTANQHLSYHRKGALKPPQNRHFSEPSKKNVQNSQKSALATTRRLF